MNKYIALVLAGALVSGCSTTLNGEGANVRTAHDGEDLSNCEFRGMVTAKSPEFAITPGQEAEYAMNDARNKVGERGGNIMKMVTSDQGTFTGVTINAEAYRCSQ
ncbi:MAG: hypothetical protein CML03_00970 [Pseudooceanicola sp.]|nr:hypothetical protein [Pseudooceanicola sp.]|tara:strand:+ start:22144 stop:22458 length:315 start_codon:yes stop_codon:yes gene_type:complete